MHLPKTDYCIGMASSLTEQCTIKGHLCNAVPQLKIINVFPKQGPRVMPLVEHMLQCRVGQPMVGLFVTAGNEESISTKRNLTSVSTFR